MPSAAAFKRPESVLVVIHTSRARVPVARARRAARFLAIGDRDVALGRDARPNAQRARCARRRACGPHGLRDAHVQRAFPILPAWRERYAPDVETNLEHLWYLELPQAQRIRRNEAEHCADEWLDLDAAIRKVSSWTNREALERLRDSRAFG